MAKKVLWFSRHEMTGDQLDGLKALFGDDLELTQVDRTINSAYELSDEIGSNDVLAIVAPINIQSQFLKLADGKPVIMAENARDLIPSEDGGETKAVFRFVRWIQLDEIHVATHELKTPADIR